MAYPLTALGVAELLKKLYALPNNELNIEALAIKANFRNWVSTHFELAEMQLSYLNSMPDNSVQYFGDQCWFCFIHRLDITLDYPSAQSQTRVGKWTGGSSSTKLITNNEGNEEPSGSFSFSMIYREN
ncbi:MAG: hypothetical protein A3D31_17595 [Candidatus Fluviicola riflensis]|nr:MAG: hypothetical protein CHH17_02535 [Candidatus Fluviicola riflensis]OGS76799.1 MAG: hypothetical protein A3D31_17595 [Candidatus Fluviicola riflensis]OGS82846.1 MAG: hypothetical protein A2724_13765 [Fluviicola sp. RIFCSPHIGHO2_01_FULL_43_53]OGS88529.1 MAG: hypothetical protein A3E30_07100 [Fluviicola sp. RIFCSPHIGHO2_12_FULL_43_24]